MVEMGQVMSMPDVLLVDMFDMTIPAVPGGGDSEALMIRNQTAVLPGRRNDPIPVELHRYKVNFAGKMQFTNTFTSTYVDSIDLKVTNALRNWQNLITNPDTGIPYMKSEYATTGIISIYGGNNKVVEQRTFFGLWVANIADVQLNGASDTPLTYNVTWCYDYWKAS